jgi:hypothetical protein
MRAKHRGARRSRLAAPNNTIEHHAERYVAARGVGVVEKYGRSYAYMNNEDWVAFQRVRNSVKLLHCSR